MTPRKPANLLLVDDDPSLLKLLGMRLTSEGFNVTTAESGQEALRLLMREKIDLVISDLRMDEMDGMALFAEIQKHQPGMPVIILTAHGSIPDAVAATQQGVFSFLTKPVDRDALYKAIDAALELSIPAGDDTWREEIVTRSPVMLRLLEQAKMVAQSDVSVLINGQSGTGKEVLAQAIHAASPRAKKAFIAINCGALPEQLLESELFGHAKGAFTGAVSSREGLFQAAEGGTLFLDEIGDMPLSLQVKLLRVLQERKVRPLGSNRDLSIDVRIISATHRDLPKAMAKNEFREDLYYRLNVVNLKIPALHERSEDIPLLANHLLRESAKRHKPFVRSFSTDAMKRLMTASWPGNVRQLVNVIEQCVALTSAPVISEALVEQALEGENTALPTFVEARNQFELNYLRKLLQITKGNVTQAARMAGRNRTEFYKLLSRHELDANDFKEYLIPVILQAACALAAFVHPNH
ncbi:two-component system response regulator [Yersinia enterocolitica]|nr:two-component system response regulator [Yersinia enterocolitica]